MNEKTAEHLVHVLSTDLRDSVKFNLSDRIQKLPLTGFHSFANGKPCMGAFKVNRVQSESLWVLVIDWRGNGNFYVVIYPEDHNLAPIAELHNVRERQDSIDLVWKYITRKRDEFNEERKKAFIYGVGGTEYVVSLPGSSVTVDDFLNGLFTLAAVRVAADERETVALPEEVSDEMWEGGRQSVTVNRYERNAVARAECIEQHGSACAICGFDFGKVYGGNFNGFIHVHHKTPLAEVNARYRVDPINDLIPVCPNCHAVIHYGNKTRSVEEVRQLLADPQPNDGA